MRAARDEHSGGRDAEVRRKGDGMSCYRHIADVHFVRAIHYHLLCNMHLHARNSMHVCTYIEEAMCVMNNGIAHVRLYYISPKGRWQ